MTKKKLFNQKTQNQNAAAPSKDQTAANPVFKLLLVALIWIIGTAGIIKVVTVFVADTDFAKGTSSGDATLLKEAVALNGSEEAYHRNLGLAYAIAASSETDPSLQAAVESAADNEFIRALTLNPSNLLTLKAAVIGYEQLGQLQTDYLAKAKDVASTLMNLSPTDPSLWYEAAKVETALGNKALAKNYYDKTISLKNDPTLFPALPL